MSARSVMTMRATVQRNQASGEDEYHQPVQPDWQDYLTDLPCYFWTETKTVRTSQGDLVTVAESKMIVPKTTDITEEDRVTQVTDRQGNILLNQTVGIDSVIPRRDHLALTLQGVD